MYSTTAVTVTGAVLLDDSEADSDTRDLPSSELLHAHFEELTPSVDILISPTFVAEAELFKVTVVLGAGLNVDAFPMVK